MVWHKKYLWNWNQNFLKPLIPVIGPHNQWVLSSVLFCVQLYLAIGFPILSLIFLMHGFFVLFGSFYENYKRKYFEKQKIYCFICNISVSVRKHKNRINLKYNLWVFMSSWFCIRFFWVVIIFVLITLQIILLNNISECTGWLDGSPAYKTWD